MLVALAQSGDNIDLAIQYIKRASQANKELYNMINNMKGFTTLVHTLGDKFHITYQDVANKFGTEIAKQYVNLGKELLDASLGGWEAQVKINKMKTLLLEGADPNFKSDGKEMLYSVGDTPLDSIFRLIDTNNPEKTVAEAKQLVHLLLTYGAVSDEKIINSLDSYLYSLKDTYLGKMLGQTLDDKVNEIRQMLEKSMKK